MKKKAIIISVCAILAICAGGFAYYSTQRSEQLKENKNTVTSNIEKLDQLKNDVFISENKHKEITDVLEESKDVLSTDNFNEIKNIAEKGNELVESSVKESEDASEAYKSIKTNLSDFDSYKNSYFYKDLSESIRSSYEKDIDSAKTIIDENNVQEYVMIANELVNSTEKIKNQLDQLSSSIYSLELGNDLKYPYAINYKDGIFNHFRFVPLKKQSSSTPTDILFSESRTTDGPNTAALYVDRSSPTYIYTVKNVDTKEIKVQTESGEIENALVNTQIQFTPENPYNKSEKTQKSGKPGYIFVSKDSNICIAMEDYDNNPYYILYVMVE